MTASPFTGDISVGCVLDIGILLLIYGSEGGQVGVNLENWEKLEFALGVWATCDYNESPLTI